MLVSAGHGFDVPFLSLAACVGVVCVCVGVVCVCVGVVCVCVCSVCVCGCSVCVCASMCVFRLNLCQDHYISAHTHTHAHGSLHKFPRVVPKGDSGLKLFQAITQLKSCARCAHGHQQAPPKSSGVD